MTASVLWRRLDRPGHEAARVSEERDGWTLSGSAVFSHENAPCALSYRIVCDRGWRTRSAGVTGWVGSEMVLIEIEVAPSGEWLLNGAALPSLRECVDIDLNFSPSTNLLPIRRLALAIGEERAVRAAWLRFPGFLMEPLEQTYRRLAEDRYLYTSGGGKFRAELGVDANAFLTRYPGFAERVGSSG